MENLPILMNTAGEILMNIVTAITDNLDTILDQGITILLSLIERNNPGIAKFNTKNCRHNRNNYEYINRARTRNTRGAV